MNFRIMNQPDDGGIGLACNTRNSVIFYVDHQSRSEAIRNHKVTLYDESDTTKPSPLYLDLTVDTIYFSFDPADKFAGYETEYVEHPDYDDDEMIDEIIILSDIVRFFKKALGAHAGALRDFVLAVPPTWSSESHGFLLQDIDAGIEQRLAWEILTEFEDVENFTIVWDGVPAITCARYDKELRLIRNMGKAGEDEWGWGSNTSLQRIVMYRASIFEHALRTRNHKLAGEALSKQEEESLVGLGPVIHFGCIEWVEARSTVT